MGETVQISRVNQEKYTIQASKSEFQLISQAVKVYLESTKVWGEAVDKAAILKLTMIDQELSDAAHENRTR